MTQTAYHINELTKNALSVSEEEWDSIRQELSGDLYKKLLGVTSSISLIRKSLDFTKEAEQVAKEVVV